MDKKLCFMLITVCCPRNRSSTFYHQRFVWFLLFTEGNSKQSPKQFERSVYGYRITRTSRPTVLKNKFKVPFFILPIAQFNV